FVQNVDCSASDAAIANAILSLGVSLNLVVTAEGVERTGQLEWLRARGCNEVQGFLLSKPLSAQELEQRLLEEGPAEQSPLLRQRGRRSSGPFTIRIGLRVACPRRR